jgi:hypothetical protein
MARVGQAVSRSSGAAGDAAVEGRLIAARMGRGNSYSKGRYFNFHIRIRFRSQPVPAADSASLN